MSDTQAQYFFRLEADRRTPSVVDAISQLIAKGEDRDLNRINLLDSPAATGSTRKRYFGLPAFGAARAVSILAWNVLLPRLGGVLGAHEP
jgi:hypothetical protein